MNTFEFVMAILMVGAALSVLPVIGIVALYYEGDEPLKTSALPVPSVPINVSWTAADARQAAELYRQVPSAFWLGPEYTGAPQIVRQPPWKASPSPRRDPYIEIMLGKPSSPNTWMGKRIHNGYYSAAQDAYRFQLEGGEWFTMPKEMIEQVTSRRGLDFH